MTGQSDIEVVRDATDLVRLIGEHVALRPKGREHVGLCPFHDDKNPSLAVVTHKGNAFYKCHSCGAGGDAFDFVMAFHRMDFAEALRYLADRAGVTLQPRKRDTAFNSTDPTTSKRTDLKKANAFAATYFRRVLADPTSGAAARDVIQQRAISDEMVEAFMIGAAPDQWDGLLNRIRKQSLSEDIFLSAGLLKSRKESNASSGSSGAGNYDAFRNRLIFPICDKLGNPIAFGARKIKPEDEPKYLNSAESPLFSKSKTLYGLHRANRAIIETKQAIVTEGYTDVIACHQAGITNVVGTLGTALTRDHARELSRVCDTVILVFDGDEAGQKAADRGLEVFFTEPVDVKICVLPDQLDPDELLKQPGGRDQFNAAVAQSIDAIEYKLSRLQSVLQQTSTVSGREKLLLSVVAELANLGFVSVSGVRKRFVVAKLAELFQMGLDEVQTIISKARPKLDQPAYAASVPETRMDGISRARRVAEYELVSLLIFDPSAARLPIKTQDGTFVDVGSIVCPTAFRCQNLKTIATCVLNRLQNDAFTVQQLIADLELPADREMAMNLYFEGEKRCRIDEFSVALAAALRNMESCLAEERQQEVLAESLTHRTNDDPCLAADLIRRTGSNRASAIPRYERTGMVLPRS